MRIPTKKQVSVAGTFSMSSVTEEDRFPGPGDQAEMGAARRIFSRPRRDDRASVTR